MDSEVRRRLFAQKIPRYRQEPVVFCREVLCFEPDSWQKDVLNDIAHSSKVTVRSGQGVGKTGIEACALLWFLTCFPFPRIVATAPTKQQLHDVLWSEVAKWQSRSPLLSEILKWTKTYIYLTGYEKRWFAVARTATKPENMQGFHEDNMLFIVDEASGVADPIMEAILGTLSGVNNKLLMCGNPTRNSGVFYDSHTKDRSHYKVHKVSSLDSTRTNKDNIESLMKKYGAESNVVRVRVLGEFPKQEDDVFIGIDLIESGMMREFDENAPIDFMRLGVDIARFGDDETVIAQNINHRITLPHISKGHDLMATTGKILEHCQYLMRQYPTYHKQIEIVIDDTGLGGGVTDRLNEVINERKLDRLVVYPVNFASAAPKEVPEAEDYDNIVTYVWAEVRELLRKGVLILPNDDDLAGQLSSRKYTYLSRGKIALERKKDLKKRGLPSPDRADAVALSCYHPPVFIPLSGAVVLNDIF